MEAAIFNCQCDQMQNCEGGCETIYDISQAKVSKQSNFRAEMLEAVVRCAVVWVIFGVRVSV
jgi:hypothetical protein